MAGQDVTASTAPPRGLAAVAALERVAWLAVLRVMLGAVFVSTFFENLNKHLYEVKGYTALIAGYRVEGTAPGAWKDVERFVADHASFFAPVQAVVELSAGALLVLGIGTGVVALVTAGQLTALWVSELAPRRWVWEILSLVVIAFVVALSALPALFDRRHRAAARLLGPPTFGPGVGMPARLGVAVLGGLALAGVILAARTGGEAHYTDVAWQAGLTFGALLALLGLLDRRRDREGAAP
jgi:uncharacterized membrane protein YphA (DoxX/SURF4 family)